MQNLSIFKIGNDLTYDDYTAHVWIDQGGGHSFRFEGFLFYDDDIDGTKGIFRTGDVNGPGQVTDLTNIDTGQDLRNEAYVLGRFVNFEYRPTPVQTGGEEDAVTTALENPNNPTGVYVQSITRDLDSISKSTASNFVGMPKRTLIQDPSIGSQSQADYLSLNFVKQYSRPPKNIELKTLGNPLLEVGDKITVEDDNSQVIDSAKSFWVTDAGTNFDDTYTSDYDATTFRPIGSFFPKPQPNVQDDFGGVPILNLRIDNRGTPSTRLNGAVSRTETGSMALTTVTGLPLRGYIYLKKRNDPKNTYEIIKYDGRDADGTDPGNLTGLSRGLQYSSTAAWTTDDFVIGAYDPYQQEGTGIVPTIKFDSLISGKFNLKVSGDLDGVPTHIDTLTGLGSEEWPNDSWDTVQWGPNQLYVWGARDMLGSWNRHHIDVFKQEEQTGATGYYVAERKDIVPPSESGALQPQQSRFYLNFKFIDDIGDYWNYSSKEGNGRLVSTASISTRRGPVGKVNMHIQWKGCWYPKYELKAKLADDRLDIPGYGPAKIAAQNFNWFATTYGWGNQFGYIDSTAWAYGCIGADSSQGRLKPSYGGSNIWPFQIPAGGPGGYEDHQAVRYWNDHAGGRHGVGPVFFTATANGGDGLHLIMRSGGNLYGTNDYTGTWPNENLDRGEGDFRVQEELDPDYRRFYSLGLKYRRNVIGVIGYNYWTRMFGQKPNHIGNETAAILSSNMRLAYESSEGDVFVDDNIRYDFYNDGKGYLIKFNPKNLPADQAYDFIPTGAVRGTYNLFNTMLAGFATDANIDGNIDHGTQHRQMSFQNYVNFFGDIVDNSGRSPKSYGDLFKTPHLIGGELGETTRRLLKDPADENSRWRWDENPRANVVCYADLSLETHMENYSANNMPNMVRWARPPNGWFLVHDVVEQPGDNSRRYHYFPNKGWDWSVGWYFEVE